MLRLIIVSVLVLAGHIVMAQTAGDIVKVGDKMPAFTFKTESGNVSSSSLKGKVVMLNFFATWCPPCRKELPHVEEKIWEKYKSNSDFKLMVIGREHTLEEISDFSEGKYTMPFFPDEGREIFALFAENSIPRNYIINREGEIVYASVGFSDESFGELLKVLSSLLDVE